MKSDNKTKTDQDIQNIPGMELNNKYSAEKPIIPENSEKIQKEMDKKRKELEKVKALIVKKYPFTQAIGILPPQAIKLFADDELGENIPATEFEKLRKKIHLYIIIPEEKFKEIPKIKKEIVSNLDKLKQDVWIYLKTPIDIWEACMDSKFELVNAIGMSFLQFQTRHSLDIGIINNHKNINI